MKRPADFVFALSHFISISSPVLSTGKYETCLQAAVVYFNKSNAHVNSLCQVLGPD